MTSSRLSQPDGDLPVELSQSYDNSSNLKHITTIRGNCEHDYHEEMFKLSQLRANLVKTTFRILFEKSKVERDLQIIIPQSRGRGF